MLQRLKNLIKKLPGIRRLVAQRDMWWAQAQAAATEAEALRAELDAVRSALAATQEEARRTSGELQARVEELAEDRSRLQIEVKGQRARARTAVDHLGAAREEKREARRLAAAQAERAAKLESELQRARAELEAARAAPPPAAGGADPEELAAVRGEASRFRRALREARRAAAALEAEVERERAAKQEIRQKVLARGWKPGYARNPDYDATRDRFFEHCVTLGRLQPDGAVLDVGCGIGGVGVRLANYLGEGGRYDGFDVDPRAIEVANQNVAPFHPGFTFQVADVWNSKYNPEGRYKPTEYRFPFDDDTFDLVILRSVFTHMLPEEIDHYMAEIARTLKPGGRALITYFLLDEDTIRFLDEQDEEEIFKHDYGLYRLYDPEVPEAAVAVKLDWVQDLYPRHGLTVAEPILFGSWRIPDAESLDGQDLITGEKLR